MRILVTMVMVVLVNLFLLLTTAALLDSAVGFFRMLLGAVLGGSLAGISMLVGHGPVWHILSVLGMCCVAFGTDRSGLWHYAVFSILHLAVSPVAAGTGFTSVLLGAAGIALAVGIARNRNRLVPVVLKYRDTSVRLTALRDTGNTLIDPVTGKSVLIVDARIAGELTGLSQRQLQDPVGTMGALPGLRLIPYHTVGSSGFLLALPMANVEIGPWKGCRLVAFSPGKLEAHYQALIGGMG